MDRIFKIHCSQIGKIMGRMGLTDKQQAKYDELHNRKFSDTAKPLTANMEVEYKQLHEVYLNPELPATATTFLREWYAKDREEIWSKYIDKGNYVEDDLIEFMADVLGYGMAEKNKGDEATKWDDYLIGTCDVALPKLVIDVKAPWNNTALQSNVDFIDSDYVFQGRGYMRLWDKPEFILFYGLMNTPADVNFENEITYDHIPTEERWIAYKVTRDIEIENQIVERVKLCREWLNKYDSLVKSKLGKVHSL